MGAALEKRQLRIKKEILLKRTSGLWQHIANGFEEAPIRYLGLSGKGAPNTKGTSQFSIKEMRSLLGTNEEGAGEQKQDDDETKCKYGPMITGDLDKEARRESRITSEHHAQSNRLNMSLNKWQQKPRSIPPTMKRAEPCKHTTSTAR